ncbi:MAG TPA: hypothetical protein V6D17_03390 [Candidatus Obscuribacterales bacterium]
MPPLFLIPVLALAAAGLYATFKYIPDAVKGLYRMNVYAPPAAMFIVAASTILILGPYNGMTPDTAAHFVTSIALMALFAIIGLVSIIRGGYAALWR